jgi:flagellar protein FliS
MMGHSRGNALAAYQSVATHGGVAAADAHGLVLMMLDGVLERVARARIAIVGREFDEKARLIDRATAILEELRSSLDFEAGGELARNLDGLYDYCSRQLLRSSATLAIEPLDEVGRLLRHVRETWVTVRADNRKAESS